MLDPNKLSKLTVGDIAKYEQWRREQRRKELILNIKDIHGDNIPAEAFKMVEAELSKIPSLMDEDGSGFDITAAQYLFWLSFRKSDKDITLDQVGDNLEVDKLDKYSAMLFPATLDIKKKPPRNRQLINKRKPKKPKKNPSR